MNTLRRISRHMVKAVAAGAVMVAAALPVAFATTAGAASTTNPTITCSQLGSSPVSTNPFTCGSLPYGAAGSTIVFYVFGSGFANDNGASSVTTTAPGVQGQVTELSTSEAQVVLYTSASTTPGYYPITITDDNGSATLATAFGVDPTGSSNGAVPNSIAVGSTRLITVTGEGLSTGTASILGPKNGLVINGQNVSPDGTTLTFYATGNIVGTYQVSIGVAQFTLTVTGPTITGVSVASSTGYVVSGALTTSQTVTVTGSGFESGASVQLGGTTIPQAIDLVTFSAPTVVNGTTLTFSATVAAGASLTPAQLNVTVINPDGTMVTADGALGVDEAGTAPAGAATLTVVTAMENYLGVQTNLTTGNSYIVVQPSPGYTITTGSTVTLSTGTVSFTGTVIGVDPSNGDAAIAYYLPANLQTSLTAAVPQGVDVLPLTNLSGISVNTNLTFTDTGDVSTVSGLTPATSAVDLSAPTASQHASGTVVQWPVAGGSGAPAVPFTLSVNNGTATAQVAGMTFTQGTGGTSGIAWQYMNAQGYLEPVPNTFNLAPGTYTFFLTYPGMNLTTGSTIAFADASGTNVGGLTGTIVATGADTATVRVTVPATASGSPTLTQVSTLQTAANVGQTWLNLLGNGNNVNPGDTLVVGGDPGTLANETVTVASTWNPATWYPAIQQLAISSGITLGTTTSFTLSAAPTYPIVAGMTVTDASNTVVGTVASYDAGTQTVTLQSAATATETSSATLTFTGPGGTSAPIPLTSGLIYGHQAGDTVSESTSPQVAGVSYDAFVTNAAGSTTAIPFATTAASGVSISSLSIAGETPPSAGPYIVEPNAGTVSGMLPILDINGKFPDTTTTGGITYANASDYVVSSTTPGVTFGPVQSASTGSDLYVPIIVAPGTPVNTSIEVTVTDLNGSATTFVPTTTAPGPYLSVGTQPTITAVQALPTLTAGESAPITITGTGFNSGTTLAFLADAGNLAGGPDAGTGLGTDDNGINIVKSSLHVVSSTTITATVSVGMGASNGAHDLFLVNGDGGSASMANVLNVSMPTVASVTPASGQSVQSPATSYVLSGVQGFGFTQATPQADLPAVYYSVFDAGLAQVGSWYEVPVSSADVAFNGPNSLVVTIPTALPMEVNGYLVFTLSGAAKSGGAFVAPAVDAPAIALNNPVAAANTSTALAAGTSSPFTINVGGSQSATVGTVTSQTSVTLSSKPASVYGMLSDAKSGFMAPVTGYDPFTGIVTLGANLGTGSIGTDAVTYGTTTTFLSGATVSVTDANGNPVPGITVSGVSVLPGLITGQVAVAATGVSQGTYDLVVTNPDGSTAISTFTVLPSPTVMSVNGQLATTQTTGGPLAFLAGSQQTLAIVGTGFQEGATVSTPTSGVASFGTATVNGPGTLLTVPVTFTSFSGSTPVTLDVVITNPTTGGSVTIPGELVVSPGPTVTGTYYVPTFTSNTEVVINGTGFEQGITATSSNSDYTVSAVSSTPTTVTLLVSTDSNATSGTSSNVTLTNPDGGTVTFALNGGVNPNTLPKAPRAFRTVGAVWTSTTAALVTTVRVTGRYFYGQPKVTANAAGVKVGVSHDSGSVLTLVVHTPKNTARGVHTFTITFSKGQTVTVKFNLRLR